LGFHHRPARRDFNADGVVNAADELFKFDFDLPDDDPALAESQPDAG
jgi:hypothetical protein